MKEKLLEVGKDYSVEKLVEKINKTVEEKFEIIMGTDDVEKWNGIPKFLLLSEEGQKRLLKFVDYMDELSVEIEDKVLIIISLSGIMETENVNLNDYDDGSLFTLAQYYQKRSMEDINKTMVLIGNNDLLLAVRKKTLELDVRQKILSNIEKRFFDGKIDNSNLNEVSNFIEQVINELESKDYYELINELESKDYYELINE